ncbi:hypothetical protein ACQP25_27525 [Microtetraspora malaysiensis]|uniref:hypothetical protein n=1 Tax=Microtetraspora malaysiensis TaxID=161358 RepID=UPI003D93C295
MLSKRVRLALSVGVLGVALTTTLAAAANADEAPRPGAVACENANVTVTEQDGKLVVTVDGKEVEGTAAAVITPAKSVPAAPAGSVADADDSGASVGDASAVAPMTEATEATPAYACASSTATK